MGGLAKRVRAYVRLNGVGYTLRRGVEKVRDRGLREYDRLYRRERAGEAELAQQRERKWQAAPLVSILVPVYNTDPAMLLAAAASNEKTKGRARLSAMLKSGRELRVFPIRFDDLKGFAKEARRYGIAYAVVKQKDGESVDLLVRTEDASKVNRIAERLGLCRMRDDAREAPEPREGNRHDGRAHAAQAPRAPEQAAALLDDLLASPGDSDASPLAQAPAESRPSGPTSARKRLSEKDGEAARKRCGRLSVRAEMRAISAAREMSGEAHATRKPMARALEKGR